MFKDKLAEVPKLPGCYQMYNKDNVIIYVGKAKNLFNRLHSYFTGRVTGKTKKNVLLVSLASCIGASVLFYVMMMVTMVLAKHGYISPFMGAWFPVFFFIVGSLVLLKYSRT